MEASGSWLWIGNPPVIAEILPPIQIWLAPDLAVVGIWGVSQGMEHILISISFPHSLSPALRSYHSTLQTHK